MAGGNRKQDCINRSYQDAFVSFPAGGNPLKERAAGELGGQGRSDRLWWRIYKFGGQDC
jgi:hypothetical protein